MDNLDYAFVNKYFQHHSFSYYDLTPRSEEEREPNSINLTKEKTKQIEEIFIRFKINDHRIKSAIYWVCISIGDIAAVQEFDTKIGKRNTAIQEEMFGAYKYITENQQLLISSKALIIKVNKKEFKIRNTPLKTKLIEAISNVINENFAGKTTEEIQEIKKAYIKKKGRKVKLENYYRDKWIVALFKMLSDKANETSVLAIENIHLMIGQILTVNKFYLMDNKKNIKDPLDKNFTKADISKSILTAIKRHNVEIPHNVTTNFRLNVTT